jgi:hypothetical protein
MADTKDLKSFGSNTVRVQVSLPAPIISIKSIGPLAQWLEHPAHNRVVLSSSLRWPTNHSVEGV